MMSRLIACIDQPINSANTNPIRLASHLALLVLIAAAILSDALTASMNHDEDQYIASGNLFLNGLYPFVDYPYYHQPVLPLIYAFLFASCGHFLLTARVFSTICVWATIVLVFRYATRRYKTSGFSTWELLILPAIIVLQLSLSDSLHWGVYAWEHPLATLMIFAAFLSMVRAHESNSSRFVLFSGILFAIAVGIRAPLAPMLLPFFGAALYLGRRLGSTAKLGAFFFAGCLLGSIPNLVFLAIEPRGYIFGLIRFHAQFDQAFLGDARRALPLAERLGMTISNFSGTNTAMVAIPFVWIGAMRIARFGWAGLKMGFAATLAAALLASGIFVAVMKNVTFLHYFYTPLFFLVAMTIEFHVSAEMQWRPAILRIVIIAVGVMGVSKIGWLAQINRLWRPEVWFVTKVHDVEARFIKRQVGDGIVLTLSPMWPIEGNCKIYKEFVTEPFAYRTAEFVPKEDMIRRCIVGKFNLDEFLNADPPQAIYTGWEGKLDADLERYGEANGFIRLRTPMGKTLLLKE